MMKSRSIRWAGHVARNGEMRNAYWISIGKPYGKRSLGGLRRRWEGNMKAYFREIESGGMDRIYLVQSREQVFCEHGNSQCTCD
jgi:hypothetical protein